MCQTLRKPHQVAGLSVRSQWTLQVSGGAAHITQESELSFVSAAAHWWAAGWKLNVIILFQCSHFISKKIETEQKQPVRWEEGIILQFQKEEEQLYRETNGWNRNLHAEAAVSHD